MYDLSANAVVTIIFVIVAVISVALLVIRDRWRNRVGLPAEERQRLERDAYKWGILFLASLFGVVSLVQFAKNYGTPEAKRWGFGVLLMFYWGFTALRRGKRLPRDGSK